MSTALQDRIKALLGKGISPATVAAATQCEPSYISQLMSDETFLSDVQALRLARLENDREVSEQISRMTKTALDQLESVLPTVMDPMKLTRVFSTLAAAAPKEIISAQTHVTNNIVNLSLPEHVARRYVLNAQREVVAVEGTDLISMPSSKVLELSKAREKANERGKQLVAANNFNGVKLEEL